jgi:3-hydroxyisobutyrate dehydrogenase-like beta-hydroxyacid dehydrogenase
MNTRNSVIGFIGLGAMGSRMAKRLVDAGFKVLVFDRTREKAQALAAHGAAEAPSAATYQMNVARAARHPDEDYSSVIVHMRELSVADGTVRASRS